MSRPPSPPRIVRWRGEFYLFFSDKLTGKRKRLSCPMLGAHSAEERASLVRHYKEREQQAFAERLKLGAHADFDRPLAEALDWFLAEVKQRADLRRVTGARDGLAASSARRLVATVDEFKEWLPKKFTTGQLDGVTIKRFFTHLAQFKDTNVHRANLKVALRWLGEKRPKLFSDPDVFWPALKLHRIQQPPFTAFAPEQLRAFRAESGRLERMFLLMALTGARLAEVLALTWADVDLKTGRIVYRAKKTHRVRVVPLIDAPEFKIAPNLIAAMKDWDKSVPPAWFKKFPMALWKAVCERAKVAVMPQQLRKNFVSYCGSCGVPPATCALWCGHSEGVASSFYRGLVLSRRSAKSIESAMGLD